MSGPEPVRPSPMVGETREKQPDPPAVDDRGQWESWVEHDTHIVGWLPDDDHVRLHHRIQVRDLRDARMLRDLLVHLDARPGR